MPSCVLRYCKKTSKNANKSSGITFHRFPRQVSIKENWIKFVQINRSEETWLPAAHSMICSSHFKSDDFKITKTGRRYLLKTAIPFENTLGENVRASPTSLDKVQISETDSIFDTPRKTKLKNDIRKIKAANQLLSHKLQKVKRQNTYLKQKNKSLTAIVKEFKGKFGISTDIETVVFF